MTLDASNVRVAGTGGVAVAPEGTALPADPTTALPSEWLDLGYTSEDGVTFTISRDQQDILAWQSSDPVRVLVTNEPKTIAFELLQFEPLTVELALRGGEFAVLTGTATYTPPAAGVADVRAMVIDMVDVDIHYRFCYSRVSLSGDVSWQLLRSDALRLPLEFGVQAADPWGLILTDDPDWVAYGSGGAMAASASTEKSKAAA